MKPFHGFCSLWSLLFLWLTCNRSCSFWGVSLSGQLPREPCEADIGWEPDPPPQKLTPRDAPAPTSLPPSAFSSGAFSPVLPPPQGLWELVFFPSKERGGSILVQKTVSQITGKLTSEDSLFSFPMVPHRFHSSPHPSMCATHTHTHPHAEHEHASTRRWKLCGSFQAEEAQSHQKVKSLQLISSGIRSWWFARAPSGGPLL